jgi:hypothetical protein
VLLDAGDAISFDAVRERVAPNRPSVPLIKIPAPDLSTYDRLIEAEVLHDRRRRGEL